MLLYVKKMSILGNKLKYHKVCNYSDPIWRIYRLKSRKQMRYSMVKK